MVPRLPPGSEGLGSAWEGGHPHPHPHPWAGIALTQGERGLAHPTPTLRASLEAPAQPVTSASRCLEPPCSSRAVSVQAWEVRLRGAPGWRDARRALAAASQTNPGGPGL